MAFSLVLRLLALIEIRERFFNRQRIASVLHMFQHSVCNINRSQGFLPACLRAVEFRSRIRRVESDCPGGPLSDVHSRVHTAILRWLSTPGKPPEHFREHGVRHGVWQWVSRGSGLERSRERQETPRMYDYQILIYIALDRPHKIKEYIKHINADLLDPSSRLA